MKSSAGIRAIGLELLDKILPAGKLVTRSHNISVFCMKLSRLDRIRSALTVFSSMLTEMYAYWNCVLMPGSTEPCKGRSPSQYTQVLVGTNQGLPENEYNFFKKGTFNP